MQWSILGKAKRLRKRACISRIVQYIEFRYSHVQVYALAYSDPRNRPTCPLGNPYCLLFLEIGVRSRVFVFRVSHALRRMPNRIIIKRKRPHNNSYSPSCCSRPVFRPPLTLTQQLHHHQHPFPLPRSLLRKPRNLYDLFRREFAHATGP
jgi:hypothetical protein